MGEMVETVETFLGVSCDVNSCSAEMLLAGARIARVQLWSKEFDQFELTALYAGWSLRVEYSRRGYCPAHEANAYADVIGRWGARRRPRYVRGRDVRGSDALR